MANILDFNFNNEYSATAFKRFVEKDETINQKAPHIGESLFGKDNTTEEDVVFLIDNLDVDRIGSLGAIDMPTPLKGFKGTKTAKQNFPYFVEGWKTNQEEAKKLARIMRNSTGKPSDRAIMEQVLNIYKRTNRIVNGMRLVREYMIMQMLTNCHFTITNADEYKLNLSDYYNYDPDGTWATNNVETLTGNNAWSDTENSDPIADLIRIDKKMKLQGARLEGMICTQKTFDFFLSNKNLKNYSNLVNVANYIFSQQDVERLITIRLGHTIKIFIDEEVYVGYDDASHNFYPNDQVTLIGSLNLGTMWSGVTYEEDFNLVNGKNDYDSQVRLNDGIVVSEYMMPDPDGKVFRVSQSCIPSFEGRNLVYNLKWASTTTTYTVTYNGNGNDAGTVPSAQTVEEGNSVTVAAGTGLTKSSKAFLKWNTADDGTGTDYAAGATLTPTANVTLYAIYES